MQPTKKLPLARTQKYLLCLALLTVLVTGAVSCHPSASPASADGTEPLPVLEETTGDYRYEYHVPSGREFLYDAKNDERGLVNVMHGHEQEAAKCRQALEARLGPGGIDAVRARYSDIIRHLHAMGYL